MLASFFGEREISKNQSFDDFINIPDNMMVFIVDNGSSIECSFDIPTSFTRCLALLKPRPMLVDNLNEVLALNLLDSPYYSLYQTIHSLYSPLFKGSDSSSISNVVSKLEELLAKMGKGLGWIDFRFFGK